MATATIEKLYFTEVKEKSKALKIPKGKLRNKLSDIINISRNIVILFCALFSITAIAHEHGPKTIGNPIVAQQSWVEEWDAVDCRWVKVSDTETQFAFKQSHSFASTAVDGGAPLGRAAYARYARPGQARNSTQAVSQYGPFLVISRTQARMVDATNTQSPRDFDAMLRDFPEITTLSMVEAPGTTDDIANLAVGRKIREAGIATHVPFNGSVRSGAVELFLAGATRSIDDGAVFAVHSWRDDYGREADDFESNHPAHRMYIEYYVEMGMNEKKARKFYDMTNSVPHASALWLRAAQMRDWLPAAKREIPPPCRSRTVLAWSSMK